MEESETMEKLLEYALEWLKTAESFTMEQAPLIVQEFYMWETATSIFWMCLGIFFIIVSIGLHIKSNRYGKDEDNRWDSLYEQSDGFFAVPVVVSGFLGFIMFLSNVHNLIYILVAPRMYLIETVTSWLSGGS